MIGAEVVGGGFEVGEGKLRERREVAGGCDGGIIGAVGGRRRKIVDVGFRIIEMRASWRNSILRERRCATAHNLNNQLGAPKHNDNNY